MLEKSFMPYIIAFCWISAMLLVGTVLRAKVPLFQKYLVPASLIGGLAGFVLMNLGWVGAPFLQSGWQTIPHDTFEVFSFYLFTIGFVALGLMGHGSGSRGLGKEIVRGSLWMALAWSALLCIQAIAGLGVFSAANVLTNAKTYEPLGYLIAHGFGQGPGQALAIGAAWQSFKIEDAVSIGLFFAALGSFVGAFTGVPLVKWGLKKGFIANAPKELPSNAVVGLMKKDSRQSLGSHTTHPSNVDTLALHLAVLGLALGLTYLFCYLLRYYFYPSSLASLTFGFAFFYGMMMGFMVRFVMDKVGIGHLLDNELQNRIVGTSVDFLVVATMMAIKFTTIWKYIIPLAASVLIISIITLLLSLYFARRFPGPFGFERMLVMYGIATGTAATGLLLLRIVDPEFKTPAAVEAGIMNFWCLFTSLHIIFLVSVLPGPGFPDIVQMTLTYAVTGLACLILMKLLGLWKGQRQF